MIKVSVIVTSCNNAHNLERCLNSLLNQDYDKRVVDLEIIVVDSDSTDGSFKILNKYKDRIKIILKPKEFYKNLRLYKKLLNEGLVIFEENKWKEKTRKYFLNKILRY
jgi:glycosyltransferase involved in cell wall biosynthesis